MSFRHRERRANETPGCNLNEDGLAWAACGKPLVSKWKALRSRGCSLKKCAGITTARFPTGYSGPWKTLISVPRLQDQKMTGQADSQETTPAGFPQPLFRCEGSRRLLLRYQEVTPRRGRNAQDKEHSCARSRTSQQYSVERLQRRSRRRDLTSRHGYF